MTDPMSYDEWHRKDDLDEESWVQTNLTYLPIGERLRRIEAEALPHCQPEPGESTLETLFHGAENQ